MKAPKAIAELPLAAQCRVGCLHWLSKNLSNVNKKRNCILSTKP